MKIKVIFNIGDVLKYIYLFNKSSVDNLKSVIDTISKNVEVLEKSNIYPILYYKSECTRYYNMLISLVPDIPNNIVFASFMDTSNYSYFCLDKLNSEDFIDGSILLEDERSLIENLSNKNILVLLAKDSK